MIGMLVGNEESHGAYTKALDRKISSLRIEGNELVMQFEGSGVAKFWDAGQSCCENRWMHTDDDLSKFIGATFLSVETRPGGETGDEYEYKDSEFLIVTTSAGSFTIVNYNEHNGYYGGFLLRASLTES